MKKLKLIILICINSCFKRNSVNSNSEATRDLEIQKIEELNDNKEIIDFNLTLESGKSFKEELEISIANDDVDKLENLIKSGLRINKKYKGKNLLVLSFELKKDKIFKYLILKGAILTKEFEKERFLKNINEIFLENVDKNKLKYIINTLKGRDRLPEIIFLKDLRYIQKRATSKIFEKLPTDKISEEESNILNKIIFGANINEISLSEIDNFIDGLTIEATPKIVEEFLNRYEGDINFIDSEGRTLLSKFLEQTTNINTIKKFLKIGLDPNISKKVEYSALNLYIANLNILKNESLEEDLINKTERIDILDESLKTLENKNNIFSGEVKNKIIKRKNMINPQLKV